MLLLASAAKGLEQPAVCPCDCNGDRQVAVAELVSAVNIVLDRAAPASCVAADSDSDGSVAVNELVLGVNAALAGCDSPATPTASAIPTATSPPNPQLPPQGGSALAAWLEAGSYLGWAAESARHASGGPHFGDVRTYVNEALRASLEAEQSSHPRASAVVKELFGRSGGEVRGWSVMIKIQDDSQDGHGWYWYEGFDGTIYADSAGAGGCTGCHGSDRGGFVSKDFVLTPFPLQ